MRVTAKSIARKMDKENYIRTIIKQRLKESKDPEEILYYRTMQKILDRRAEK